MALTTVTVHGEFLDLDGLTPAVGTVTFRTLIELRDLVDNIVYPPADFVATLDLNGEFTIVLPATDNPDITPLNWVYQVYINTTTWRDTQYVQLPFAPGVTEYADLALLDYDPCTGLTTSLPLPPDPAALFVLKAGDTMTGNLIINANLQVSGDANVDGSLTAEYQGVNGDVMRLLSSVLSTNVTSGGVLTPNVDPTKIDISPMTGWIVDYDSSATPIGPTNPIITYVNYPGVTGLTPAFTPITHFRVDSTGTLIQQLNRLTPIQRRQSLQLGFTVTEAGTIIVDQTIPVIPSQLNNQLCDLMNTLGPFIEIGSRITPNGVNLTFNRTTGTIFTRAFGQVPNYLNPHLSTLTAQTPTNFRHMTALFPFASALTSILDVANYDPGGLGVVTPIGGGANTSTTFRIWAIANNTANEQILVQYGQNTYASLTAARDAIGSTNYIPTPLSTGGALVGWITATRTATNLSDPTQAVFTQAGQFDAP